MGHELAERRFLLRLPATAGEDGRRELLLVAGVAYAHAVPIDPHHARQLLNARFPRLVGEDHHRQDARLAAAVCGVVECRAAVGAGEYDAEHLRALESRVGLDCDAELGTLLAVLEHQGAGGRLVVRSFLRAAVLRGVLAAHLAARAALAEHLDLDLLVVVFALELLHFLFELEFSGLVLVDDDDRHGPHLAERAVQQVHIKLLGVLRSGALLDLHRDVLHCVLAVEPQGPGGRLVVVLCLCAAVARRVLDLHGLVDVAIALHLDFDLADGF
mmetsp:Transcript_40910/g.118446  ORF Transcript_40910/g.118446 Transcript_40910/m.118446 type:complete len:272 (+) Transcript_40910:881-1696(+)